MPTVNRYKFELHQMKIEVLAEKSLQAYAKDDLNGLIIILNEKELEAFGSQYGSSVPDAIMEAITKVIGRIGGSMEGLYFHYSHGEFRIARHSKVEAKAS